MSLKKINMQTLYQTLNNLQKDEVILDVRGRDEFAEGHIQGALNIPHDEVEAHTEKLKSYRQIYIHCHAGKRAEIASAALKAKGFDNLICIAGSGMADWLAAGYPVTRGA